MSSDGTHTGTGGGLPYRNERPFDGMVCQELPDSCMIACARQLLLDAGVEVEEAAIRLPLGYVGGIGGFTKPVAKGLNDFHPNLMYAGGNVEAEDLRNLMLLGSAILVVQTDYLRRHAILLDAWDGEWLTIRDPWGRNGPGSGNGSIAEIHQDELLDRWRCGFYDCVSPIGRKVDGEN